MSRAYPTWGEQSIGGKLGALLWVLLGLLVVLALAALVVLFAIALVGSIPGAIVDTARTAWPLLPLLLVIGLVVALVERRRAS